MQFVLTTDLTALKAAALTDIDRQAEAVRGLFITLGAGQSMVYLQKRREAEMVSAATSYDETTGETVTDIAEAEVPNVSAEAQKDGVTLFDKAAEVLTMSYNWEQVSALIEVRRLARKALVDAATHQQEIDAATAIDWSDIEAMTS